MRTKYFGKTTKTTDEFGRIQNNRQETRATQCLFQAYSYIQSIEKMKRNWIYRLFSSRKFELFIFWIVLGAVAFLHGRWILVHFTSHGYLFDSGWFAHLFESADPLLKNPRIIDELSYYSTHLSPYLFLFGAPLAIGFGLNGVEIFAIHQGLFFGLFYLALYLIAAPPNGLPQPHRLIAMMLALLIGSSNVLLFQAAGYPHFEISMIATTSLALATYLRNRNFLFVLSLLMLPLIREDGGFYAALICLLILTLNFRRQDGWNREQTKLIILALAGVLIAALCFLIKSKLFPGADTFGSNFSGDGWSHLSAHFMVERLANLVSQNNFLIIITGTVTLSSYDRRYLSGLVLLSPLIAIYLLAVRDELGQFTLYYGLPWLLICLNWVAVFVSRGRGKNPPTTMECLLILGLALSLSSPVQHLLHMQENHSRIPIQAVKAERGDIRSMIAFLQPLVHPPSQEKKDEICASIGIAALIPDALNPKQFITAESSLKSCRQILLLHGDMDYDTLRSQATKTGFILRSRSGNAEHWSKNDTEKP
ncbi:hypothetical protein [Candidatus Nitrotoga fabula]|uniref:Uncharacterized protein n=1 Tax=Candidatus Nitrotoga fabula TaxID=2182327 RepID=A0A916BB73_9PROT|nr:hypothetical protein [Candidatus Nitrotoga fabula]CAE6687254.1 conserved membrane hypothetical protein [Candidatus Nitrotoga fabula]